MPGLWIIVRDPGLARPASGRPFILHEISVSMRYVDELCVR